MGVKSYGLIFVCCLLYDCSSYQILTPYPGSLENINNHYRAPKNSTNIYYHREFGREILYCKTSKADFDIWLRRHSYKNYGKENDEGEYQEFDTDHRFDFDFKLRKFDVLAPSGKLIKKIRSNNGGYLIYYDEKSNWLYYEWSWN